MELRRRDYSNIVSRTAPKSSAARSTNPGCVGTDLGLPGRDQAQDQHLPVRGRRQLGRGPLRDHRRPRAHEQQFDLQAPKASIIKSTTTSYTVNWFTGLPAVGSDFPGRRSRFRPIPSNYNYRGFFEDHLTAKGNDWQGRLDFEYEPAGLDFLPEDPVGRALCRPQRDARRAAAAIWTPTTRRVPNSDFARAARLRAVQLRLPRRQPQAVPADLAGADVRQRVGQHRRAAPVQHRSGRAVEQRSRDQRSESGTGARVRHQREVARGLRTGQLSH